MGFTRSVDGPAAGTICEEQTYLQMESQSKANSQNHLPEDTAIEHVLGRWVNLCTWRKLIQTRGENKFNTESLDIEQGDLVTVR